MESANTAIFFDKEKVNNQRRLVQLYTIQCMMLCRLYINYVVYTLLKDKLLTLFSTVYRINPIKILQEPIQKGEY